MPSAATLKVLKDVFGFAAFRPGQAEVVEQLMAGNHTLAVMPTGGGKSLCYQLPACLKDGLTIVVSPLIALMQNQVAQLRALGVAAATVNSNTPRDEKAAIWREIQDGTLKLLYVSPELLAGERVLAAFGRLPVAQIIVDEAHCISQWGHDFRPSYQALGDLRRRFPNAVIGAFTATADKVTREDIQRQLMGDLPCTVFVHGFDRPNIALRILEKNRPEQQLETLLRAAPGPQGIVYRLSRKKVEQTAAQLCKAGWNALPYHAGLDAGIRATTLDRFLSEPDVIVVATIAFGMGIDKPDVRFVYHLDMPGNVEAYYQEIGRAGRDGAPAEAVMLYGMGDLRLRRMMIEDGARDDELKRVEQRRLDALVAICEASTCRKQALLRYFGEEAPPCGACDRCLDPPELKDASELARHLFTTIEATGSRFGQAHIIDIVQGKTNEKIEARGHDRLATFGSLAALERTLLQSALRQLYAAHYFEIDIAGYGALKLTDRGRAVLAGEGVALDLKRHQQQKSASRGNGRRAIPQDVEDPELLARLKAVRLELARERAVPAFVIFSDATLIDMANRRPADRAAFREVHGVGESKCEAFAEPFLKAIAAG